MVSPTLYFYPRSPCGERRMRRCTVAGSCRFLSTLSLRRATIQPGCRQPGKKYFYPRSPCGERPAAQVLRPPVELFLSTLSLRRATASADCFSKSTLFLSTLSLRRATCNRLHPSPASTHFYPRSPCGERRLWSAETARRFRYFYPRSPCGERRFFCRAL